MPTMIGIIPVQVDTCQTRSEQVYHFVLSTSCLHLIKQMRNANCLISKSVNSIHPKSWCTSF